jgi:Domain of unknown function (DUF4326)
MIRVGNLRDMCEGIRCDRLSPLGNPFVMLTRGDEEQRKLVIQCYARYLHLVANLGTEPNEAVKTVFRWEKAKGNYVMVSSNILPPKATFMAELDRIAGLAKEKDITLLCWCYPLACHCDRIVDYINWKNEST